MRRNIVSLAVALAFAVGALPVFSGTAEAHVHGITPCAVSNNPLAGGLATNTTPAASANGGPITGLIPRDVGNAPLQQGDGGQNAPSHFCPQP